MGHQPDLAGQNADEKVGGTDSPYFKLDATHIPPRASRVRVCAELGQLLGLKNILGGHINKSQEVLAKAVR